MGRKRQNQALASIQPTVQPQLLSIPEVARILAIGRVKVYQLIKQDGLPSLRVGSVMRVSLESLQAWIAMREQVGVSSPIQSSIVQTAQSVRKRVPKKQLAAVK